MTAEEAETEILELSIKELRIKYALINNIHDQLRVRVLAMLTVVVALATYTFKGMHFDKLDSSEKFLFGLGAIMLAAVFAVMIHLTSTRDWEVPVELKEIERAHSIYKTRLRYLRYIQKDYLTAVKGNGSRISTNGKFFNISLYVLSFSAIILLALKR